MNTYYQSLLEEVVSRMKEGRFDQADSMIESELSLPYVPTEVSSVLEEYKAECLPYLSRTPAASRDDLENWVHGTLREKERAASALQSMNLRDYHHETELLLKDPQLLQEFKGELIEALIAQKVEQPYTMLKDGQTIAFCPDKILSQKDDQVYQQAKKLLETWMYADSPSFEGFCQNLLEQELLETRPMDFTGKDPEALAASIVHLVCRSMMDDQAWEKFILEHPDVAGKEYPLLIEKRGDYSL